MNNKICPLLSVKDDPLSLALCESVRCAWWAGERCAIVDIALNTADIQGVADMIDAKVDEVIQNDL